MQANNDIHKINPNHNIHSHNHHHLPKDITDPFNLTESLVIGAACSVVFLYLNIYFRERYNRPLKNDEYGARILSLIHAVISAVGCGYALLDHTGGFFDSVHATRLEGDFAMFSFAYFLVDTIVMIMWKFDTVYFLHHVVTLSFCGYAALDGKYGFATCFATWGGELSNPPMHLRWLLHANNPQEAKTPSRAMKWLTFSWFVIFFVMRFAGAPIVVYYMVTMMPIYFSPLCVGIMVMSWKFFVDSLKSEMKGEWWTG